MKNANQDGPIKANAVLEMEDVIYETLFLIEATTKLLACYIEDHHYPGLGGPTACGLICQSIETRKRLLAAFTVAVEAARKGNN